MKCIRHPNGKVERLEDADAAKAVKNGGAQYIPKKEWKFATAEKPR